MKTKFIHTWEKGLQSTKDFRYIPILFVVTYVAVLIYSEYQWGSYAVAARYFRIYPMPYFVDLQILLCGIDAIREGANPYIVNCFEGEAYFNYPYAWGILAILPFFSVVNLMYMGFALGILFFISVFLFMGRLNLPQALLYGLFLISPAVMLGLERGNSDIMIFLLLMLVPLLSKSSRFFKAIVLIFAAMLKLFPIGAGLVLLHGKSNRLTKSMWLIVATGVLFIIYIGTMYQNISLVSQKTPRPFKEASYGLGGIPSLINESINTSFHSFTFIGFIAILVVVWGVFYIQFKNKFQAFQLDPDRKGASFLIGAGVFCITCIIGYNWEYRLVFLLFTIPQLLVWYKANKKWITSLFIGYFVLVWYSLITPIAAQVVPVFFVHLLKNIVVIYLFLVLFSIYLQTAIAYLVKIPTFNFLIKKS